MGAGTVLLTVVILVVLMLIGIQLFYKGGLKQAWADLSKKQQPGPSPNPQPGPSPGPGPSPQPDNPLLKFKAYPKQDRPGNDLMNWNNPANFAESGGAKSVSECATRCLGTVNCQGFGWDPNQRGGYCAMKTSVAPALQGWSGDFYDRV